MVVSPKGNCTEHQPIVLLFYFIFIFTLFYFIILYWCCHTLTWIHHGCTCLPKHEAPSHLPPHDVFLGHSRAPAPSMLYPASDIDWRFVSYMAFGRMALNAFYLSIHFATFCYFSANSKFIQLIAYFVIFWHIF